MSIKKSIPIRIRIDEYFKENPQDRMVFEEFVERANLSDGEVTVLCDAITRFFKFFTEQMGECVSKGMR